MYLGLKEKKNGKIRNDIDTFHELRFHPKTSSDICQGATMFKPYVSRKSFE